MNGDRGGSAFGIAVAISLVAHVAGFVIAANASVFHRPIELDLDTVPVFVVSESELEPDVPIRRTPKPPPPPPPPPPREEPEPPPPPPPEVKEEPPPPPPPPPPVEKVVEVPDEKVKKPPKPKPKPKPKPPPRQPELSAYEKRIREFRERREARELAALQGPQTSGQAPPATGVCNLAMTLYAQEVMGKIKSNFRFPDSRRLMTSIGVEIARDGGLKKHWIIDRSGDRLHDEAAVRALQKSLPFPPLPKCWKEPTLSRKLEFTEQEGSG